MCGSDFRDGFFYRDVLAKEQADLEELGSLSGQLTLILGIGAVLTFVLVAAGTRSLGKVGPSFPLPSLRVSSYWYPWLPAPAHLARFVLPSLCPGSGRPHLFTCGCQHPLTWQGSSSLLLSPALGHPHLCTCGCRHPLTWKGWFSLPSPQPQGVLTLPAHLERLVYSLSPASGRPHLTRSLGKVGLFPLPSLRASSPYPLTWKGWSIPSPQLQGVLTLPAHLARLVYSLSPASVRPHLTCSLRKVGPFPLPSLGASSPYPLIWKGWSIPSPQPRGVLTLPAHLERLVHSLSPASGRPHLTRSLGKVINSLSPA
jgi:hypothetical protein